MYGLNGRSGEQPDAAQTGEEAALVFSRQFMLPQTQHAPAAGAELAGDEEVAGLVAGDLGPPEFRVLLGLGGVDRAAVPEAAVDEDGEFAGGENEVGFARRWGRCLWLISMFGSC